MAPISSYYIRVAGHLDLTWSGWFNNLTITHDPDGNTTLAGEVADQGALYGLINKARDLGLTLIAVVPVEVSESEDIPDPSSH